MDKKQQEKFLDFITHSIPRESAKNYLGLKEEETLLLEEDICLSEAKSEILLVETVRKAACSDWHAAAWLLERQQPERYSNWQKVQGEVKKEIEALFLHLEASLPPELFNAVVEASGGLRTESGDGID